MSENEKRSAFTKQEIKKIILSGLLFILVGMGYYFYLRNTILKGAERRAEETLKQTEQLIRARLGKTELIVKSMQQMAEHSLEEPETMYEIAEFILNSNPLITGSNIAFVESYYPQLGKWYEPYAGYQKGSKKVIYKQLGRKSHNYLATKWFQDGLAANDGNWSDPYYDPDGGQTTLMTYSRAIFDSMDRRVGVISADITLDTLKKIVSDIRIYPHSFCTLTSESGEIIVGAPEQNKRHEKCHTYTEPIEGKNMIVTLTVSDRDMYHRLHKSTLAFSLMAMAGFLSIFFIAYNSIQNLWRLSEEKLKNQHIEDELAMARKIQLSLVPTNGSEKIYNAIDISGILQPAKFVGGDLYDYYVRDNKLFFCIGDISGKGMPAALLMAISHSLFRTVSAHINDPAIIMKELNQSISDNNPDIMFITIFIGALDLETGVVTYCNAGHNPPILIQSGQAKIMETETNLLLGVEINAKYSSQTVALKEGDTLYLYTDGLTEAENPEKALFGEQNAITVANTFGGKSAEEQINAMHTAVKKFVDTAEQSDDLTMLAIHFLKGNHALIMNNDIEELNKLEPFLNGFFEQEQLNTSHIPQLNLALEEAVTNVIMYAYPEGEKGTAELTLESKDGKIFATLSDTGTPFNPLQQPEANLDLSLKERPIGGLGIHLIKEIMSDIRYEYTDRRNVLKMTYDI